MASKIKALTCQTSGKVVYIRDERGNMVDTLTFPTSPLAQSFGNGISVICGTMCYTYTLNSNDRLVQTSVVGV